jgi:protein ImuB
MSEQWRVACVRIPRFPIGAVWRAARRGDLGASDVQLLLPFHGQERLTNRAGERAFSPANDGAPSPITESAIGTLPAFGRSPDAPPLPGEGEGKGHWDDHPIVLMESAGPKSTLGRRRLRAVSAAAGRAGIRAGMTIAEARAICAELREYPWDDVAIAGATTEATAQLLAASPQVTPVAGTPGMWWIGASGFGGRGGERELAYTLRRIAARWHPRSRVAIADSCVAARAATWAGTSFQQGDDRSLVCIVPHGHDAGYLAPAPLALIPMPDELRMALQALGLRTVGSFAELSAEDVERRWGNEGLQSWRLARGEDPRRPVLARPTDLPMVDAELPVPTTTMEPILFLVRAALDNLTSRLATHGQGVAALSITLSLDDGRGALPGAALARAHTVTREVRLPRPVGRPGPLFERCRALLDTWTLSAPAIGVSVAVVTTAPLSGEQGDLLDATWRDAAAIDAALARLRAELGPNVVVKPVARDAHAPERMGAWRESAAVESVPNGGTTPHTATGSGTATLAGVPDPAIRLLESPESVFVVCDDGVPCAMTWRGRRLAIDRAVGPERLSGDWWDNGYRREYWRCESAFGDFVLYLDRLDDQWWVQGWFD